MLSTEDGSLDMTSGQLQVSYPFSMLGAADNTMYADTPPLADTLLTCACRLRVSISVDEDLDAAV